MKFNLNQKLLVLLVSTVALFSCESSKKTSETSPDEILKITVEKETRGNRSLFTLTKEGTTHVTKVLHGEENIKKQKTNVANWKEINRLVGNLNLEQLESWVAPTQERFYDGARATIITLETSSKIYTSQGFDEGKPPTELLELYNYLVSLENQ